MCLRSSSDLESAILNFYFSPGPKVFQMSQLLYRFSKDLRNVVLQAVVFAYSLNRCIRHKYWDVTSQNWLSIRRVNSRNGVQIQTISVLWSPLAPHVRFNHSLSKYVQKGKLTVHSISASTHRLISHPWVDPWSISSICTVIIIAYKSAAAVINDLLQDYERQIRLHLYCNPCLLSRKWGSKRLKYFFQKSSHKEGLYSLLLWIRCVCECKCRFWKTIAHTQLSYFPDSSKRFAWILLWNCEQLFK